MTVRDASITLSGQPLSFSDIARIGARLVGVGADTAALRRVAEARVVVETAMANHQPVYGSTTGVGAMKDVEWSDDQLDAFNMGLVRAHHFGTGDAFSSEIVRIAMAIRVNMALTGRVGCTTDLVEAYLALLSANVVPVVRRRRVSMLRAGMPTTVLPGGTSRVTTAPAPVIAPSPITIGAMSIESEPMKAPSPMEVGCFRLPS